MPNIKSAKKRVNIIKRQTEENIPVKGSMRTAIKKAAKDSSNKTLVSIIPTLIINVVIILLTIFKVLTNSMLFLNIFLLLSMTYYMVRVFLENDAMIKAKYLAKDYMYKYIEENIEYSIPFLRQTLR